MSFQAGITIRSGISVAIAIQFCSSCMVVWRRRFPRMRRFSSSKQRQGFNRGLNHEMSLVLDFQIRGSINCQIGACYKVIQRASSFGTKCFVLHRTAILSYRCSPSDALHRTQPSQHIFRCSISCATVTLHYTRVTMDAVPLCK